jgi:hypothetical protein
MPDPELVYKKGSRVRARKAATPAPAPDRAAKKKQAKEFGEQMGAAFKKAFGGKKKVPPGPYTY